MEEPGRIAALREAIYPAFADFPSPHTEEIAPHDCEECAELRSAFAGRNWRTMPPELIESQAGSLPLLSPAAFAYFLPAYLLYALDHFTPDALPTEMTVYQLAPEEPANEDDADWRRLYLRELSWDQAEVIDRFLDLVEGNEAFRVYLGDVGPGRRRMRRYWEERWSV